MDSLITAAARALATGDPLNALNLIALRDDRRRWPFAASRWRSSATLPAPRRCCGAQPRPSGRGKPLPAHAADRRSRDRARLARPQLAGEGARHGACALERHGDRANAAHARYLKARYLLLIGRLDEAERLLADFDPAPLPPASRAAHELVVAGVAMRRLRTKTARVALAAAERAARQARITPLFAEVESAALLLDTPAARLIAGGDEQLLRLDDIEILLASKALVVDACRHVIRHTGKVISLETRPVLFALARALAEAWPGDVPRAALLARAFRAKHADESHRARLRVEIGRLRKALSALAGIDATKDGFALVPRHTRKVAVLAPPSDEAHASVLALLADGEAWSTSAMALALGASQRTVQRSLEELTAESKVQAVGRGRARRWMTPPVPGFPTSLLLTGPLPGG